MLIITTLIVNYLRGPLLEVLRDWRLYLVPRDEMHVRPRGLVRVGLILATVWIAWPLLIWPQNFTSKVPMIDGLTHLPQNMTIYGTAAVIGMVLLGRQRLVSGIAAFALIYTLLDVTFGRDGPLDAVRSALGVTAIFVGVWVYLLLRDDDDHGDDAPRPHPDNDGGGRIHADAPNCDHSDRRPIVRPGIRERGDCHPRPTTTAEQHPRCDPMPARRRCARGGPRLTRFGTAAFPGPSRPAIAPEPRIEPAPTPPPAAPPVPKPTPVPAPVP
jgi:hypothetical protein